MLMMGGILMKEDSEFQGTFQFPILLYFLQSSIHPEMCDKGPIDPTLF